jgi:phosphoglycolate phosphatase-like HAD superfamily hydrolase
LEDVVYVGDGTWDIRACRTLGIPFIGTGNRIEALESEGATWILPQIRKDPFLEILSEIQNGGH